MHFNRQIEMNKMKIDNSILMLTLPSQLWKDSNEKGEEKLDQSIDNLKL